MKGRRRNHKGQLKRQPYHRRKLKRLVKLGMDHIKRKGSTPPGLSTDFKPKYWDAFLETLERRGWYPMPGHAGIGMSFTRSLKERQQYEVSNMLNLAMLDNWPVEVFEERLKCNGLDKLQVTLHLYDRPDFVGTPVEVHTVIKRASELSQSSVMKPVEW